MAAQRDCDGERPRPECVDDTAARGHAERMARFIAAHIRRLLSGPGDGGGCFLKHVERMQHFRNSHPTSRGMGPRQDMTSPLYIALSLNDTSAPCRQKAGDWPLTLAIAEVLTNRFSPN